MNESHRQLKVGDTLPQISIQRTEAEIISSWKNDCSLPLVSVLCHTYNQEEFVKDALNSFLIQETDFPIEIIVHDDASTDGTAKIIEQYVAEYPNIIKPIIQVENQFSQGIVPSKITYVEAKGKYIALCEGDDYWFDEQKLQRQVDSFEPDVSMVFHDSIRVEGNVCIDSSYYANGQKPILGYSPFEMVRGAKVPTASVLMLSDAIKNVERFNIINGDHYNWSVLARFGRAIFINEPMSVYRHHAGGIWSARLVNDKIEAAIKSKKVIFEQAPKRFKFSALLGFNIMLFEFFSDWKSLNGVNKKLIVKTSLGALLLLRYCEFKKLKDFKTLVRILMFAFVKFPSCILGFNHDKKS